jgi:uncharacterized membrane protein YqiK
MNTVWLYGLLVVVGVLVVILGGIVLIFAKLFHKVEQGRVLVVSTMRDVQVTFVGRVVIPVIHKAEFMDISVKTLEIDRRGSEGLICEDNIRADIKVTFFVRVNKTKEDVIKVAQAIGCARASDQVTLNELFNAKFSEALKTVGKQLEFVDLYTKREEFRDRIIHVIGRDLNGYVLEDCAIDFLEQTPLSSLDSDNILDAQGIKKITELTAAEKVLTNFHQNDERKSITRQNVEAQEAILELEKQQADAEARQAREIGTVQAREQAETLRVQAEERLKAERARLTTDEQLGIQEENLAREVAVAEKNKERVIAIETERIEKDRQLEVVSRERETDLARMGKDREVEVERRGVSEVTRERVAVDKTVAEQEEAINTLRIVEDAERQKQAVILAAEAEAQEGLVKDIKAAEAAETASHHLAKERLTLSQANLEAADMDAKADIRRAEALKATEAAPGLATVEVKERDADATEKLGLAEARIKEADAVATEKMGRAEATVAREIGTADGDAIRSRIEGEAEGLTRKAEALGALDDDSRTHEEYRMRIDALKEVQINGITAQRDVARAQAELIAEGLQNADIDIVGGDSIFFDRLVGAIAYGKSVDAFVDKSDLVRMAMGNYLEGDGDLGADLRALMANVGSDDLKNLSVSALLMRLMAGSSGETADALGSLLDQARQLGVADLPVNHLRTPETAT